ncbi:hypothetical protein [Burkholderia sp. Bp8986]|uniref:hypothetical protein n=1 Tax=Burkholderia sp. Bp8986 TaxID=2184550 RepID=UPI000F596EFB|nr:hypothetical protein [Burkholderia sp. Bp8986]
MARLSVGVLLENDHLQPVRVANARGSVRVHYMRTPARTDNTDFRTLMAALDPNKIYEMNRIARAVGIPNSETRLIVSALVESGQLMVVKKQHGKRTRTFYRLSRTTPVDSTTEFPSAPMSDCAPKPSSYEVFKTMKPGIGYCASSLAEHLNVSVRRARALLSALHHDGHVVRMKTPLEHHSRPVYLVAGSQPDRTSAESTVLTSWWSTQPTFDVEYGRSLRMLRAIAEASRR